MKEWAPRVIALLVVLSSLALFSRANADTHDWVAVAHDANYDIQIDRAKTERRLIPQLGKWVSIVETLYRTNHKQTRLHKEKQFNREVVHSILMCDSLWFKVKSVTMSMGDGRPVSRQVLTWDEVYRQTWHRVELGTSEEIAARAACHFAGVAVAPAQ